MVALFFPLLLRVHKFFFNTPKTSKSSELNFCFKTNVTNQIRGWVARREE